MKYEAEGFVLVERDLLDIPRTFRPSSRDSGTTDGAMLRSKPAHNPKYDPSHDLGMLSPKPILFLILWYIFSGLTLFFNKYIVAVMGGSEAVLSSTQMLCTLIGGYIQLSFPLGMFDVTPERKVLPKDFNKNMMIVGGLRFATVLLGIFALDYLEISFTETVKSTAPAFTVIISKVLLGEVHPTLKMVAQCFFTRNRRRNGNLRQTFFNSCDGWTGIVFS